MGDGDFVWDGFGLGESTAEEVFVWVGTGSDGIEVGGSVEGTCVAATWPGYWKNKRPFPSNRNVLVEQGVVKHVDPCPCGPVHARPKVYLLHVALRNDLRPPDPNPGLPSIATVRSL